MLIAILFLVHMKVNFAAILNFFFQIYSAVTFSPNPVCYKKYVILSSTCLAVYLSNSKYIKNGGCFGSKGQIKVISFQRHNQLKTLQKT